MLLRIRFAAIGLFIIIAISVNAGSFIKGKEPATAPTTEPSTQSRESDCDPLTLVDKNATGFSAVTSALRGYARGRENFAFTLKTIPNIGKAKVSEPVIKEIRFFEYKAGVLKKCRFFTMGNEEVLPSYEKTLSRLAAVFGKPRSVLRNQIAIPGTDLTYVNWKLDNLVLKSAFRERERPDGKIIRNATFDVIFLESQTTSAPATMKSRFAAIKLNQRKIIEKWLGVPLEVAYGNRKPVKLLIYFEKDYLDLTLRFKRGLELLGIPKGIEFSRTYIYYKGKYRSFRMICSPEEKASKKLPKYEDVKSRLKCIWKGATSRDETRDPDSQSEEYISKRCDWFLRNGKGILFWEYEKEGILAGTSIQIEIQYGKQ